MNKAAFAMTFVLAFLLLALGFADSALFVQAAVYIDSSQYDLTINVDVSSPIQGETYFTNEVPLSFSYESNIINSSSVANYTLVLCYNLDGQPIFDMFGNAVFGGETTRIGEFYPPAPLWWSAPIHVPNGSHSLFVLVTFWVRPVGENQNKFEVHNVSKVVNFAVSAETHTLTPSPDPTPSPTPTTLEPTQSPEPQPEPFPIVPVAVASTAVIIVVAGLLVYLRKRKHEKTFEYAEPIGE